MQLLSRRGELCRAITRFAAALLVTAIYASLVFGDDATTDGAIGVPIEPPFAWNRTDHYQPPDFEAFFPNDQRAGEQLDQMIEGQLTDLDPEERLALIRAGLRNTSHHRTTLLGSVGNQLIWNQNPPNAQAMELMYHASAAPDPGLAEYALYHGPTVTSERTANLVRMLMERFSALDQSMQQRIAWGMQTYGDKEATRTLLLQILDQHEALDADTVSGAVLTYESVFGSLPPDSDRFELLGRWAIAFHRCDVSADHPRAAELLRRDLDRALRHRPDSIIDFVTRVDGDHETAVALVQGLGARVDLMKALSSAKNTHIDFEQLFSPRLLLEYRVREFARHLPSGVPEYALPAYTRPTRDSQYAHLAAEFVAPDFKAFFADDADAAKRLDAIYATRESLTITDRELLELFRRGIRRSSYTPNEMFGWIAGSLGWPRDPLLNEIFYQALDPEAPLKFRDAGIYYGFGLGTEKSKNVLEAMFRTYMAPPFDRSTNGNMRARLLWGVRDHEDDKHYLATRFESSLREYATMSDEALHQADFAYRELTGTEPPNADSYATRGVYLVVCSDDASKSIDESKHRLEWLDETADVIETQFIKREKHVMVYIVVRGSERIESVTQESHTRGLQILFAGLLTRELIAEAEDDSLRQFEKHLPAP